MSPQTRSDDTKLVEWWMKTAKMGELHEHRLGCLVRVRPIV